MGFIAGGQQRGAAAEMFRRIYWDMAQSHDFETMAR